MTHTNHRAGTPDSLSRDYIVFMYGAKGLTNAGAGPKIQEFLKMSLKHHPVNFGQPFVGNMFTMSYETLLRNMEKHTKVYVVFDDRDNAAAFVKEVKQADFGVSIIVSGLIDEVEKMSKVNGIKPHTAQCSLGIWGKTEKLPEPGVLEVTTMCGHAMISFNLVRRMAAEVKKGKISLAEAGATLAKPCVCGVFNPKRAEELLQQYIAAAN
jgi:hypothetical protein